jgi:hypothetical protein
MDRSQIPIVDLRREEIEDARRLSIAQKLALSGDLFDSACEVTLSGIRGENPGISREQALEILRQRLELARRLETRL